MPRKKLILSVLLGVLSLLLGYTLGQLDFFGFLDNKHVLYLSLLFASFLFWYALSIVIFLLDFSDKKNLIIVYFGSSLLFGSAFLLANINGSMVFLNIIFFFLFLFYVYEATLKRFNLYLKFVPNEIFIPVAKHGFLFLLVILAFMGYSQAKNRQLTQSLITPIALKTVAKPFIIVLNKQLGAQLQAQLGDKFQQAIGTQNREQIVRFVLDETIEGMTEGKTRQLFGFRPDNIPVEKTIVNIDGTIDITPVIDYMLPEITLRLNKQIDRYGALVAAGVAIIVVLFVQPFLAIFQLFFGPLNNALFAILFSTGLLKKKTIPAEKEIVQL